MNEEETNVQTGKQAYEARKTEKLKEREKTVQVQKSVKQKKSIGKYILGLVVFVLIGVGFYFLVQRELPEEEDFSRAVPIQGREHIEVGVPHGPYNSNPPTSGPHYEQTADTGFREEPIPDEHIVHNLEHGDIWVSYHPRISGEVKDVLKTFAGSKVIITPRDANEIDIALAAWGRLDTFNVENGVLDEERIDDFIKRYINKGPERVTASPHTGI